MEGQGSKRPATRSQTKSKAEAEKDAKRRKREAKLFQPSKVIGPLDIPVNLNLGQGAPRIKVEVEQDVKPEVERLDQGDGENLGNGKNGLEVDQRAEFDGESSREIENSVVIVVKQEVDIPMDLEEPEVENLNESVLESLSSGLKDSAEEMEVKEEVDLVQPDLLVSQNEQSEVLLNEQDIKPEVDLPMDLLVSEEAQQEVRNLNETLEHSGNEEGLQEKPESQLTSAELPEGSSVVTLTLEEFRLLNENTAEKEVRIRTLEEAYKLDAAAKLKMTEELVEKDAKIKMLEDKVKMLESQLVQSQINESDDDTTDTDDSQDKDQGPSQPFQEKQSAFISICCPESVQESVSKLEKKGFTDPTILTISPAEDQDHICSKFNPRTKIWTDTEQQESKRVIKNLLIRHGEKIEIFKHISPANNMVRLFADKPDCYRTLISWLSLMPSLEELIIDINDCSDTYDSDVMVSLMQQHKFPSMPKLKHLTLKEIPFVVIKSAVLANAQITSLEIFPSDFGQEVQLLETELTLPNLNQLSVCFLEEKRFDSLLRLRAPLLKTIRLGFDFPILSCPPVIFTVLDMFKETLHVVQVGNVEDTDLNRFPEMPFIKQLSLKVVVSHSFLVYYAADVLRMLKPMQTLERLEVRVRSWFEYNAENEQLYKDLLVSKMWEQLPLLQEFVIGRAVCNELDVGTPVYSYFRPKETDN